MFEQVYEAMREAGQALLAEKGFKPYSHEATIAFLAEQNVLPLAAINKLDGFRILRNKSVYGAKQVSKQSCLDAIGFATTIVPILARKLK